MSDVNCIACGAPGMEIREKTEHYTAPFGRPAPYQDRFTKCGSCDVSIDVSDESAFPDAIKESERTSIEEILKSFHDRGISQAAVERQLELPQHCLSHWNSNGDGARSLLALMRIVRAYPWIIEVADLHFDETVVQQRLLEAAVELGELDGEE